MNRIAVEGASSSMKTVKGRDLRLRDTQSGQGHNVKSHIHKFRVDAYTAISSGEMVSCLAAEWHGYRR